MHYHLIGICGTAMASLAGMLQARGHRVTGSDENVYPPMSTMLESLGIPVMQGYRAEHLSTPPPDCVVVGNAMSRGNAEVEETLNRRLVYRSQAEVVKEEFIRGRRSLVVAGTHGKTTTTSIATWVMERGGLDPSFLVGGVVQNFGASFRVTESPYFLIEGDEYDTAYFDKGPKFMHYLPETAVVGNIEFDHADIYKDLDAIKLAFRRLMNLVPGNGRLVAGWDSPAVRETLGALRSKYAGGRLVAVFEPRSATSRLAVFQEEYVTAFDRADYVVLSSVFAREKGSAYGRLLDTDELTNDIA